jgi:hypothetical protein
LAQLLLLLPSSLGCIDKQTLLLLLLGCCPKSFKSQRGKGWSFGRTDGCCADAASSILLLFLLLAGWLGRFCCRPRRGANGRSRSRRRPGPMPLLTSSQQGVGAERQFLLGSSGEGKMAEGEEEEEDVLGLPAALLDAAALNVAKLRLTTPKTGAPG